MRGIKVLLDISLIILIVINLFFLGIGALYGGLIKGLFYYVLTDSPEFSHISNWQIEIINFVSTFLIICGTVLPLVILLLPKIAVQRKRIIIACLSIIPISFLLIKLLLYPEPDSFTETSMGGYRVRKYEWDSRNGRVVKCWISEEPASTYNSQERVKWRPYKPMKQD